ncbi:SanA/YdcF family protein [Pseudofulvibacter geojedonensis]
MLLNITISLFAFLLLEIFNLRTLKRIVFKVPFKTLLLICTSVLLCLLICNHIIEQKTQLKTYSNVCAIPKNKVGLLLGASKYIGNGRINPYYQYRIDAAIELYNSGKITHLLISGDNSRKGYDEPTDFKTDLIALGIPSDKIYLDYAGFRTLDSIVRAKEIFNLKSFTIISQNFHNKRAIYLAEKHGLSVIAFNAKDVIGRQGDKTNKREYLARVKAVIDILLKIKPKYLGSKVLIK